MRPRNQRPASTRVTLLVAVPLVACGTALDPVSEPWDRPVPDAQSTTELTEQANVPIDEIEATTPEEILALVTAMESGMWATDAVVSTEIAGTNASGTVVGFARTTIDEHPLLRATALRFDMRNDAGTWHIVAIERRFHCAGPTATEFCQ